MKCFYATVVTARRSQGTAVDWSRLAASGRSSIVKFQGSYFAKAVVTNYLSSIGWGVHSEGSRMTNFEVASWILSKMEGLGGS